MKNLGIRTKQKDVINREDLPTKLPNPSSISFTGAATGSYDGSSPLSIEIPTKITSINGLAGGTLTSPLVINSINGIRFESGGKILDKDDKVIFMLSSSELTIGVSNYRLVLRGSNSAGFDRPTYNNYDMALTSDIKNAKITLKQGTTEIGSFTLNQAADATFTFSGGGGTITSIDGLSGGTLTSPLILTGGDSATAAKIILSATGQITDSGAATLFGFLSATELSIGSPSYITRLRGSKTRPTYNGNDLALFSDIGNGTLTIKQDGVLKGTFTANQSGDTEIDLGIASTSILPSQIKGASDTQSLFVGCDNQEIAFNVGNKPTYCGTDTGITWGPNGFGISQGINESSGIWFDGDGINMWSPCDRDAITYYDEDDGSKVFKVSKTGIVYRKDGEAALYTGDKTACPYSLSITYDGTTTTYDGSEAKSITITTPTIPTNYVTTDTEQTITGKKTFGSNNPVTVRLDVANYSSYGYNGFWVYQGATSGAKATRYYCGKITNRDVSGTDYALTLPLKSGTIALTSDITGGGGSGGGLFRHDTVISDTDQSINLIVSMYTSSEQELNNANFMNYISYFGGAYLSKGDLNGTKLIYLSMNRNGTDSQKLDIEVCTEAFTGIESLTINIADINNVFISDTVTQC